MSDLVAGMARLSEQEEIANKHLASAIEFAAALHEIKSGGLYKFKSPTWETYLQDHWSGKISRSQADRIISAHTVKLTLESGGAKPKVVTTKQAQKLQKLPTNLQVAAYEKAAKKRYEESQTAEPTTEDIDEAVAEIEQEERSQIDLIRMYAADFSAMVKAVKAVGLRIEQLSHHAHGAELSGRMGEVRHGIDEIIQALRMSAPYCECCYCGQKNKCDACKGRGWISKALYRNASKELQDKVTEHA